MKTNAALLLTSADSPAPEVTPGGPGIDVAIVTAAISASVAVIVVLLAPLAQSWRERRDDVNAKFDTAVGSLLAVQAARDIVGGLPGVPYPGTGHSSISVTSDIYTHLIGDAARRAAESASALVPRAVAQRMHNQGITTKKEEARNLRLPCDSEPLCGRADRI